MIRSNASNRPRNQVRKARPALENLEGRVLLYAASGNRFGNGADIRFSIVPDGTDLGGATSNLYATLDKAYGKGNWLPLIEDAAAKWEYHAGLNLTYVYDNGAPIGSGAYQEGNPNFGDIRIGGFVQSPGTLAFTLSPPPANGDSSSGDIFINTGVTFGGANGTDLESVVLHELGHALGLAHSTDKTAVMYPNYSGVRSDLAQDDIYGIETVWGPKYLDAIAQNAHNFSYAQSADITSYTNQYNQIVLPSMNVAIEGQQYWFKVKTPANASSTLTVVVQSQGLSLLSPEVAIANGNSQILVDNAAGPGVYGTFEGAQIFNVLPNTYYWIGVAGSTTNFSNSDGAYALIVNMGSGNLGPVSPPNTVTYVQPSQGGGGSGLTSASHPNGKPADPAFDFTHVGTLNAVGDNMMIAPSYLRQMQRKATIPVHTQQHHPAQRTWSSRLVTTKHQPMLTIGHPKK